MGRWRGKAEATCPGADVRVVWDDISLFRSLQLPGRTTKRLVWGGIWERVHIYGSAVASEMGVTVTMKQQPLAIVEVLGWIEERRALAG